MTDGELQDTHLLIRDAQAGVLDAYDRLFGRYYARVRELVRRRLGAPLRGYLESGDVLQEALIEAFRSFDSFDVQRSPAFLNWLAGIVENRIYAAARHARAAKRDRGLEVALDHVRTSVSTGVIRIDPPAELIGPSSEAARNEDRERVWDAIEALDADKRRVIVLRHFECLPWEQIADELGKPSPDAARMFYLRAKVELKQRLGTAPEE